MKTAFKFTIKTKYSEPIVRYCEDRKKAFEYFDGYCYLYKAIASDLPTYEEPQLDIEEIVIF